MILEGVMLFYRPDTNDYQPDMVLAARGLPRAAKTMEGC